MFVHSEKVPRLYKSAAKILKDYKENSGNIKDLLYQRKHPVCFKIQQHAY